MTQSKRPIIVIHGAPEWMVTFGDMMSLLLTFFILLFSVAQMKDAGRVYDMIYALQGMTTGSRPLHGYLLPDYKTIVDNLRDESTQERRGFGEAGVHSRRQLQSEGDGFYSLRMRDQLKIIVEGEILFEEGGKVLLARGREVLSRTLVPRFRDGPFRIILRGHAGPEEAEGTEAQDDLGYARAKEVRDFFIEKGLSPESFELQTVGSRSPPPGTAPDSVETRKAWRRVEIFVSPQATGLPVERDR